MVQVQPGGQEAGRPLQSIGSGLQVPSWQVSSGTQSSSPLHLAPRSRQEPGESVTAVSSPRQRSTLGLQAASLEAHCASTRQRSSGLHPARARRTARTAGEPLTPPS